MPSKITLPKKTRSYNINAKTIEVIDGDTFKFKSNWLPKPLSDTHTVRLYGIDTPESDITKASGGQQEVLMGVKAKEFVKQYLDEQLSKNGSTAVLKITGQVDKYGRLLCDLSVNKKSLCNTLLTNGLAKPYLGGKKESWI